MNKETLEPLIAQKLSTYKIAKIIGCSNSRIQYWINKLGLKTETISKYLLEKRVCPRCNIEKKREEFYARRGAQCSSSYCKICTNEQTIERQHTLKKMAVEYKGGSCVKCGYNKCLRALDFHHLDKNEKDFNIGQKKYTSLSEKVRQELDKCILVCSNCHREIHDELDKTKHSFVIVVPAWLPSD